jgi:nitrous oxidase accessory protein NosD
VPAASGEESSSSSIIYIKSDGSISPSTAPIEKWWNYYWLTDDIVGSIYIERSCMVLNGKGHTLSAPDGEQDEYYGIYIKDQKKITVEYLEITGFYDPDGKHGIGILLDNVKCSNIINNKIIKNENGIKIRNSNCNLIKCNYVKDIEYMGLRVDDSKNNKIISNSFINTLKISIYSPDDNNKFYYNNFINYNDYNNGNGPWVNDYDEGTDDGGNIWHDGNGKGNYFGNYKGEDNNNDGVGDTKLPMAGLDYYPLMEEVEDCIYGEIQWLKYEVRNTDAKCCIKAKLICPVNKAKWNLMRSDLYEAWGKDKKSEKFDERALKFMDLFDKKVDRFENKGYLTEDEGEYLQSLSEEIADMI